MKFLSEISELGRSTQVVSAQSWHAKMYSYWRQHGLIKTKDYRENLCHYVRVVLIWAPIAWMYNARLIKGKISPNTALFMLSYTILSIWVVTASSKAATVAGLMIGSPVLYLLVYGFEKLYPGKMVKGLKALGAIIEPPLNWYFTKRLIGPIRPVTVAFALIVGLLVWSNPKYLISLTAAIAFWSIMIVAAYLAHRNDNRKKEMRELEGKVKALESELRRMKRGAELEELSQRMVNRMITPDEYSRLLDELLNERYPIVPITETPSKRNHSYRTSHFAEAFRLGVRFAAAKKHKICPFIVFAEEEKMQLSA